MGSRGKALQMILDDDSSDEDDHQQRVAMAVAGAASLMMADASSRPKHGGSVPGRKYKNREREERHLNLMKDYFNPNPTYDATQFRRRYRMRHALFYRILNDVVTHDQYFAQKPDALGRPGLSPEQKLTSVFRMLANGCSADATDEYTRLGESTALESLRRFCTAIENIYGSWYLRSPTPTDLQKLLRKAERRGFPGMLGSLDCMHWEWKNCPTGWAGQFSGRKGKPTVVLEAVASYDTWIWHAFFGTAGSNNDLNVLARSPLFDSVVSGCAPEVHYYVNNHPYNLGYYLADGIYPSWATFVKTISAPDTPKKRLFVQRQEAYRKDVERAFGILQARWAIIKGPARLWCKDNLDSIMMTCIILHNMIVEDEYEELDEESDHEQNIASEYDLEPTVSYEIRHDRQTLAEYMLRHKRIRAPTTHQTLRNDLINHLWRFQGEGQ